ncbi:protein FAM219B [Sminthopsis crassicaudata]|uniref:protein FAM219B n=1 Tax=Sminthopsis crassicaudata TaxID=9301 RepID=UPI003D681F6B
MATHGPRAPPPPSRPPRETRDGPTVGTPAQASRPRPGRAPGGAVLSGYKRVDWAPEAVEKRGPYIMARMPSIQAKLQKHRDLAKAVLRRKGVMGASSQHASSSGKRSVKFNKGYAALNQSADENLVSLDSDSDGELESRYSSGYSSAEQVNQDLNRQLLQDGYHLDEMPDDEDLDLIPPKPMASSSCTCCCCCLGEAFSCTVQ